MAGTAVAQYGGSYGPEDKTDLVTLFLRHDSDALGHHTVQVKVTMAGGMYISIDDGQAGEIDVIDTTGGDNDVCTSLIGDLLVDRAREDGRCGPPGYYPVYP